MSNTCCNDDDDDDDDDDGHSHVSYICSSHSTLLGDSCNNIGVKVTYGGGGGGGGGGDDDDDDDRYS